MPETNVLIDSEANIDEYPGTDAAHPAGSLNQNTIGDLHGNALKLIYFLVRQNVINLSAEDYGRLKGIYDIPVAELTAENLGEFKAILAGVTVNPVATVRLIGDELADRGSLDYYTLKIIEKLISAGVHVETLISNHTYWFYDGYFNDKSFDLNLFSEGGAPSGQFAAQHRSMTGLKTVIERGLVTREEVDALVKNYHQPSLLALSYTIDPDRNSITIYSHAPIDFTTIEAIARKLGVDFKDATIFELAATIEEINLAFKKKVSEGGLLDLVDPEIMGIMGGNFTYDECGGDIFKIPFEFLVWNRKTERKKDEPYFTETIKQLDRPKQISAHSYGCTFVRGHDSTPSGIDHEFNLDNNFGKAAPAPAAGGGAAAGAAAAAALPVSPPHYLTLYSQEFDLLQYMQYCGQQLQTEINTIRVTQAAMANAAQAVLNAALSEQESALPEEKTILIELIKLTTQILKTPTMFFDSKKTYQLLLGRFDVRKAKWWSLIQKVGEFTQEEYTIEFLLNKQITSLEEEIRRASPAKRALAAKAQTVLGLIRGMASAQSIELVKLICKTLNNPTTIPGTEENYQSFRSHFNAPREEGVSKLVKALDDFTNAPDYIRELLSGSGRYIKSLQTKINSVLRKKPGLKLARSASTILENVKAMALTETDPSLLIELMTLTEGVLLNPERAFGCMRDYEKVLRQFIVKGAVWEVLVRNIGSFLEKPEDFNLFLECAKLEEEIKKEDKTYANPKLGLVRAAETILTEVEKNRAGAEDKTSLIQLVQLTRAILKKPTEISTQRRACENLLSKFKEGKEIWSRILAGGFALYLSEAAFCLALSLIVVSSLTMTSSIAIPIWLTLMASQLGLGGAIGVALASQVAAGASASLAVSGKSKGIYKSLTVFKESENIPNTGGDESSPPSLTS